MISYFQWLDIVLVRNNKKPFVKGENRHSDSMIFIHDRDNNILNSGAKVLRVYQEESKM